jgi:ferritin-like metal-binding protein YciE
MNSMHPIHQLLQHQLRSLFDAETQFNVLLPRMIEKTTDANLRNGLLKIRGDTMENIEQIQNICNLLGTSPTGVVCKTMQDLIHEASEATQAPKDATLTDTCLMANARQIVHYEIASFDLACTFACSLGQKDACVMLAMLANRADYHNRLLDKIDISGRFDSGTAQPSEESSNKPSQRKPKNRSSRMRPEEN